MNPELRLMMRIKSMLFFCVLSLTASSWASVQPKTCKPLPLSGDTVAIKTKPSDVFLFTNTGKLTIWLTASSSKGASAGWSTKLDAGQWSALLLSNKKLAFQCVESQPGHEQTISCKDLIQVCHWVKTAVPSKLNGSFWLSENKALKNVVSEVKQRGIVLH